MGASAAQRRLVARVAGVDAGSFTEEMASASDHVSEWSNGPGHEYPPHVHHHEKVLLCLEGSIVFHLPEGDVALSEGVRMVVAAGVEHGATVGPAGVRCVEAHVR